MDGKNILYDNKRDSMEKEKLRLKNTRSSSDRLLELVEEGNPQNILAEENLISSFNELMKHGLVSLEDEKVYLTSRGNRAKKEGVENYINKLKQEQEQNEFQNLPKKTQVIKPSFLNQKKKLWSFGLLLLLMLLMVFTVVNIFE